MNQEQITNPQNPTPSFIVRAPGKCLLTGGYLILEPNQKGLSVSVDAFTQASVVIEFLSSNESIIQVISKDLHETWIYTISDKNAINTAENQSTNVYLYQSIQAVLEKCDCIHRRGKKLSISIENCNGFYYNNCKTGFGTSSTTVVTFITSLLIGWGIIPYGTAITDTVRKMVLELSMHSHFLAQGKVGSGYDIVTAVYGSCLFEKASGCHFTPFCFPQSLKILFSCGGKQSSKTSTFVKQISQWREENADNDQVLSLWNRYRENNQWIVSALTRDELDLSSLRRLFREKLEIMHTLSIASKTEIVPELLYRLMVETNQIEGVIGCIVAGAGGYDSFYCIIQPLESIEREIHPIWSQYGYAISSVRVKGDRLTVI